jgi:signal transduction histidine kinase
MVPPELFQYAILLGKGYYMQNSNFLVLLQYRTESAYNDFIGTLYHFPKKYKNLITDEDTEFIYYEPKKHGEGVYFGCGKIGKVIPDKREKGCFFAKITEYKEFIQPIPFHDEQGSRREKDKTYNATNAVRRISREVFDGICLDGGILLNFKADAHLIKVLGEQLIASEKIGILELIKNAYDANASKCNIIIEKIPSLPFLEQSSTEFSQLQGPIIIIEDDGAGMDRYALEHGWLRPASTLKTNIKERLKEEKKKAVEKGSFGTYNTLVKALDKEHHGRIPLGEKGVGRFATHRLGKNLIIQTKTSENDYELVIEIDWDTFDQLGGENFIDLDSVGVHLKRQKPSRDYGKTNSGTRLITYGGREGYELTEAIIKDIHKSVLSLKSPSKAPECFDIIFSCPQITFDDEPIYKLFDPNFTLDLLVDEEGLADIELKFTPPRSVPMPEDVIIKDGYDLTAGNSYWGDDSNENGRKPQCGPFMLHIDIWYRSKPWIDGPDKKDFTQYLDDFGGISIFRDGLNVYPAQWGATVDWLTLKTRHIKKGAQISYYNMIGNLEIEQTKNIELIDKTDREGMLQNVAFNDLAKLVRTAILFAEVQYKGRRGEYDKLTSDVTRDPKALSHTTKIAASIIKNISNNYEINEDQYSLLSDLTVEERSKKGLMNLERSLKNLKKSIEVINEVQGTLTEQAGFGLAVAFSVHEIAKITSNFYNGLSKLLKSPEINREKLDQLKRSSASLNTELRRLGPLRAVRSEPSSTFKMMKPINFTHAIFKNKFEKLGIKFTVNTKEDFEVYGRYGTINQIFSNLFTNSCYWLSTVKNKNRVIEVRLNSKDRTIVVADNGPNIDDSIRPYLFEPGYSLKIPPSGLGLYICKYYMTAMKGNIYETTVKERIDALSGAQFSLDFSRVPTSSEKPK